MFTVIISPVSDVHTLEYSRSSSFINNLFRRTAARRSLHSSPFFAPEFRPSVELLTFPFWSRLSVCCPNCPRVVISPDYVSSPSPFLFLISVLISFKRVCSLIQKACLSVAPVIILSIALWADLSLVPPCVVRCQVSAPYVITGSIHCLYFFLLSDRDSLLLIIWECLQSAPQPYLFCARFPSHCLGPH